MNQRILWAIAALLLTLSTPLNAAVLRQALVDQHPEKVEILLTDKIERLSGLFKEWEEGLHRNSIEVEFFIGAGDLRRAILQTEINPSQNVEVFIHLKNQNLTPLKLKNVLGFFKMHGVDLQSSLSEIYGRDKIISFYVKDSVSLKENRPYFGEYGHFPNMGDTSLNQLTYSPTKNVIYGKPENLRALLEGKIISTEVERTAKLPKARKILGSSKPTTLYPTTLLRMALKTIRLNLDLKLTPNPRHLQLDQSFDSVIHGFELFFATSNIETNNGFFLDPTYIEQFLKIFRERSNGELSQILQYFKTELPKTYEILKSLNLDVDLLCRPRTGLMDLERLEFRAVHKNARYKNIRPFLDKDFRIINPFKHESRIQQLLQENFPSQFNEGRAKAIPPDILKSYNAKLYEQVKHFGELDRETRVDVIKDYLSAVKYFSQDVKKRLIHEMTFSQELLFNFPYIDLRHLFPNDQRTLGDFISDELKLNPEKKPIPVKETFTQTTSALTEISKRAQEVKAKGKRAVIMVDLDNTLFVSASRFAYLLRNYDRLNETHYFANLDYSQIPYHEFEDFLYGHLGPQFENFKLLQERINSVLEYVHINHFTDASVMSDDINEELAEYLKAQSREGVRIVYLTARSPQQRGASQRALFAHQMPVDQLIVNEAEYKDYVTPIFKVMQLRKYMKDHPDEEIVAFLDDDLKNIARALDELPELPSYQVILRNFTRETKMFIAKRAIEIYTAFNPGLSCDWLLDEVLHHH
jgi:hypothetical protein